MESLGFIVTNRFILLAVDTNLELTLGEGDGKMVINMTNARKVQKISDNFAISVIGLPHKITDLYNFILNLKNPDKSYESIVEDLESIFNSRPEDVVAQLKKVKEIIPRFLDGNGVVKQEELFKYFDESPDLLAIAKESIALVQSGTELGTQVCIFNREYGNNVFGKYISIAFNLVGQKVDNIPQDSIMFSLVSAKTKQDQLRIIEQQQVSKLQPYIVQGWENTPELENDLIAKSKEALTESLVQITPFKLTPNVVFYELSERTNFVFEEPPIKLTNISFNRQK